MEHYKSRTNDFFHFSNPLDDVSSWTETEEDDEDRRHDDGSYDYQFKNSGFIHFLPPYFQNSILMGSMDTPKFSHNEPSTLNNGELLSNINRTMKKLSVNLLHAIDGLSARISQLDGKTLQLDNDVGDVKDSAVYHHRIVNGKLKQLHDILQEVQDGVQILKDKHEMAETQLQLDRLGSKRGQRSNIRTNYVDQVSLSASQQFHDPRHAVVPQLPENQSLPPPPVSCYQPVWQTPDSTSQQYPFLQPARQIYNAPMQLPHFSHPPRLSQVDYSLPFLGHYSEEKDRLPSYTYSFQFPSHPAGWAPFKEFDVGSEPQNFKVDDYAEMRPCSYLTCWPNNSTVKRVPFSSFSPEVSTGRNNTQLPTAQILPHALPLASSIDSVVDSGENNHSISVDDIIEKISAMGFRRDLVKATVRKLSENRKSVDLNVVLDKVMNGWYRMQSDSN